MIGGRSNWFQRGKRVQKGILSVIEEFPEEYSIPLKSSARFVSNHLDSCYTAKFFSDTYLQNGGHHE